MSYRYTVEVDNYGDVIYYKVDKRHRDGDLPAEIWADGRVAYYKDDKRHRDGDKPGVIRSDGSVEYWRNGEPYEP